MGAIEDNFMNSDFSRLIVIFYGKKYASLRFLFLRLRRFNVKQVSS
jgi:hypothetical protein